MKIHGKTTFALWILLLWMALIGMTACGGKDPAESRQAEAQASASQESASAGSETVQASSTSPDSSSAAQESTSAPPETIQASSASPDSSSAGQESSPESQEAAPSSLLCGTGEMETPAVEPEIIDISDRTGRVTGTETRYGNGVSDYSVSYTAPDTGKTFLVSVPGLVSEIELLEIGWGCIGFYNDTDVENRYRLLISDPSIDPALAGPLKDVADEAFDWPGETVDWSTFSRVDTGDVYKVYLATDVDPSDFGGVKGRRYWLLVEDKKSGVKFDIMVLGSGRFYDDTFLRGILDSVTVSLAE